MSGAEPALSAVTSSLKSAGPRPAIRVVRAAAWLAGGAVLLMAIVGTLDVLGTLLFDRPLPGAYELIQTLLVAAVVLPMAFAQRQGRHIRVTIFLEMMPDRIRRGIDILNAVLNLSLFALVAWFGWVAGIKSTLIGEFTSGLIPFPVWPAKLALAAGASLMTLQSLLDILVGARRILGTLTSRRHPTWTR